MAQTKTNSMADVITPERVLDSLDRVHDAIGGLVASTDPARLGDATPCKDWNVRTLINHLAHVDVQYAAMANGEPFPDPNTDHLGDDHAAGYKRAAKIAHDAFHRTGMIEQTYATPWGDVPGAVIVQHVVNELIAHGWDLARATGRPTDLVPDLAAESLAIWRAWFDGDVGRMEGSFGPERSAPAGATPADRMAAYLGRDV
jgi:uncharacterized protein (TIGR03086 family)